MWTKVADRFRAQGFKAGAQSLWTDAKVRVVDAGREVVLLKVDVTDAKNRLRDRDLKRPIHLERFDRTHVHALIEMLKVDAPELVTRVHQRFLEGVQGFVAYDDGHPIGYMFYIPGSNTPARVVHRDLVWLPIRPTLREVYAFDYFVREPSRGRGAAFVRAVQDEHFHMGYTAAYGYVYAANRPALWLYRTTGWKEAGRVTEHRVLSKLAVVDGTVYWMHPHSRSPIWGARKSNV